MRNFDNEKHRRHPRKTKQKVKSELIQSILETNEDFDHTTPKKSLKTLRNVKT